MKDRRSTDRSGLSVPILLALGLHGALFAALAVHWDFSSDAEPPQPLVQATLVGVDSGVPQPDRSAPASQAAPNARQETSSPAPKASEANDSAQAASTPQPVPDNTAAEQAAQQQAKADAEAKAQAEKAAQEQAKADAKAKAQAEKAAQEQAKADAKAKAQAEKAAQEKAKAKAQAEKAKIEAARRKKFAEAAAAAATDDGIGQEQKTRQNARQAAQAVNGMQALIHKAVEQNWYHLPNEPAGLTVVLSITLVPSTGELKDVSVSRSSGNDAFDRNALQAVHQAAPFSELAQQPAAVQTEFQQLTLEFKPDAKG